MGGSHAASDSIECACELMRAHGDDRRVGARFRRSSAAMRTSSAVGNDSRARREVDPHDLVSVSHFAARSGNAAARPLRGTTIRAASAAPAEGFAQTFRNTCADARAGGVLSAARQSGCHRSSRTRAGNPAQQIRDGRRRGAAKARAALPREPARSSRRARASDQSARAEQRRQQSERRGQVARAQRQRVALARRERPDRERRRDPRRSGAPACTIVASAQRLGIGAEQQVLAVVERQAVADDARARGRRASRAASCSSTGDACGARARRPRRSPPSRRR